MVAVPPGGGFRDFFPDAPGETVIGVFDEPRGHSDGDQRRGGGLGECGAFDYDEAVGGVPGVGEPAIGFQVAVRIIGQGFNDGGEVLDGVVASEEGAILLDGDGLIEVRRVVPGGKVLTTSARKTGPGVVAGATGAG